MTAQERDYDEVLSRVLHTTTDSIEPLGDGLAKIRERLAEPWLKRQWFLLRSELMVLGWLIVVRWESLSARIRYGSPAGADLAAETAAPATAAPLAWLRPALAVTGAVVLVVAGVFALGQIRQGIVNLGIDTGIQSGNSGGSGGPGTTNGHGHRSPGQGESSAGPGTRGHRRTGSHHPKAAPEASPCTSPTSSASATPTPTTTPTTTPTATATPTVTPTVTPTATATSTASPAQSAAGTVTWGHGAGTKPVARAQHGIRTTALECISG